LFIFISFIILGVMVRLLLVLAPATCIMGGIGVSYSIRIFINSLMMFTTKPKTTDKNKKKK
jgi:asparagine N-glycosylation enzyme membrane subunit Stt3